MKKVYETKLREVISNVESQFKVDQHNIVELAPDTNKSILSMVQEAQKVADKEGQTKHSNFVYEIIHRVLLECENTQSLDDLENITVDPQSYYDDLRAWLSSSLGRVSYVDEVLRNVTNMPDNPPKLFTLLGYAQSLEIEDIKNVVINYLVSQTEHLLDQQDRVEV